MSYRPVLILIGLGLGLLLTVALLAAFDVGKFGDPANIGEGMLVFSGYVLIGSGLVIALVTYVSNRKH